jgi:hypothetical protein
VTPDPRSTELAANLAEVRDRIGAAAGACGRPIDEITLIVVTKTWPIADVRRLAGIGVTRYACRSPSTVRLAEREPNPASCQPWQIRYSRNQDYGWLA